MFFEGLNEVRLSRISQYYPFKRDGKLAGVWYLEPLNNPPFCVFNQADEKRVGKEVECV